jgi:hypothetical protein
MPKTGQAWVRSGLLAATVVVQPNTGQAIEMLANALRGSAKPPERSITKAHSFPSIDELRAAQKERSRLLGV